MKVAYRTALITGLFLFACPVLSFGAEYDGDQILLSWSGDNAHSQTVTWHSTSKKEGYIQYSLRGRNLSEAHQVKAHIIHVKGDYYRYEAVIKGLNQQTVYQYRIGDGENWSRVRTFITAPADTEEQSDGTTSFEFLYLGDVQYQQKTRDYREWGMMLQNIRQRNPGIVFALTGGDMVNSGRSLKDWSLFLKNASPVCSFIPMMSVIGNHETDIKADLYLKMMALPENGPKGLEEEFYSFDYENCHITALNTSFFLEARKKAEGQDWQSRLDAVNRWLEEDLSQSSAKWKILVMHHPAYGISDGDAVYQQIREEWEPVFERGKADLVFCGHQHVYMRTRETGGITYIMGNSGKRRSTYFDGENVPEYSEALDATNSNYQIVRVSDRELSVSSYDEEGQLIDKWTKIAEKGSWLKSAVAGVLIMAAAVAGVLMAFRKWRKSRKWK